MNSLHARNIIVAGSQGAWLNRVAGTIANQGWKILWPDQDIDIYQGSRYLEHNRQNIEVHNIHLSLYQQCGLNSPLSLDLPRFYEVPYPGPHEFASKFSEPVVISGTCIASFLDIWVGTADTVIDVRATEQEDIETLHKWTQNSFSDEHVKDVRKVHLERYDSHLHLFPRVFKLTNAEVKDNRLDKLNQYLKSMF